MTIAPEIRRTRDGRMLCNAHRTSGCPQFHTDGCDACAEAKARGIVRPRSADVPTHLHNRVAYRILRAKGAL